MRLASVTACSKCCSLRRLVDLVWACSNVRVAGGRHLLLLATPANATPAWDRLPLLLLDLAMDTTPLTTTQRGRWPLVLHFYRQYHGGNAHGNNGHVVLTTPAAPTAGGRHAGGGGGGGDDNAGDNAGATNTVDIHNNINNNNTIGNNNGDLCCCSCALGVAASAVFTSALCAAPGACAVLCCGVVVGHARTSSRWHRDHTRGVATEGPMSHL